MSTHAVSPESLIAYDRSLPTHENDREKILAWIKSSFWGMTSKELAMKFRPESTEGGRPLNTFSGRLGELVEAGMIKKCGRRDGCGIYVSTEEPKLF